MIELDLLPEEFRRKEAVKIVMPELPIKKITFIVLPVVVGLHILLVAAALGIQMRVSGLKSEIASTKQKTEGVAARKAEIVKLRAKLSLVDGMVQRSFYWSGLLNAISDSMIKGVWLNSLWIAEQPGPVVARQAKSGSKAPAAPTMSRVLKLNGSVVGRGDETANVGRFIKELKTNAVLADLFSEIELSDMTQRKVKEFDVYDFVITCIFKDNKTGSAP